MPVGVTARSVQGSRPAAPPVRTDLAHWYDATRLGGVADGNSVGTWADEEGTVDLTQGTGSKQPTYKTGIINGEPIVRFDGTDDLLTGSFGSSITSATTHFLVLQDQNPNSGSASFFTDGGSDRERSFASGSSDAYGIDQGSTFLSSGVSDDSNPHIFTATFTSTDLFRIDGSQVASGDGGSANLSGLTVGSDFGEGSNANVDIGEMLVYDADISDADRDSVESYLSDKWGVTI